MPVVEKGLNKTIRLNTVDQLIARTHSHGLRHILNWSNLGIEPKFHDAGTFGGFGRRAQTDSKTHIQTDKIHVL